jgi:hypothetical protein
MAQYDPQLHINDAANWKIRRGGKGTFFPNRVKTNSLGEWRQGAGLLSVEKQTLSLDTFI